MIVTSDPGLARLCRSLRNQGRDDDSAEHARLGYNYRLSEVASALGSAQLRRLEAILDRREAVARGYHRRLANCRDLVLPDITFPAGRTSWFAYVVRLAPRFERDARDWILAAMRDRGIECRRYFAPLHLLPHLRATLGHRPGDFPAAEAASERTLALPLFNRISESEIDDVCETLVHLIQARSQDR